MNREVRTLQLGLSGRVLTFGCLFFVACGSADSTRAERKDSPAPVDVKTAVNLCPSFAYSMILPQALRFDEEATVVAFATDPDSDDQGLTYAWTATSGDFDDPWQPWAQYRCAAAGAQVLSVTTSDPDGCEKRLDFDISCAGQ